MDLIRILLYVKNLYSGEGFSRNVGYGNPIVWQIPLKKNSMKAQETYMDQSKENSEMVISLSVKNVEVYIRCSGIYYMNKINTISYLITNYSGVRVYRDV